MQVETSAMATPSRECQGRGIRVDCCCCVLLEVVVVVVTLVSPLLVVVTPFLALIVGV